MTNMIKVFKWKKPPNVYRSNLIPSSVISKPNVPAAPQYDFRLKLNCGTPTEIAIFSIPLPSLP